MQSMNTGIYLLLALIFLPEEETAPPPLNGATFPERSPHDPAEDVRAFI